MNNSFSYKLTNELFDNMPQSYSMEIKSQKSQQQRLLHSSIANLRHFGQLSGSSSSRIIAERVTMKPSSHSYRVEIPSVINSHTKLSDILYSPHPLDLSTEIARSKYKSSKLLSFETGKSCFYTNWVHTNKSNAFNWTEQ